MSEQQDEHLADQQEAPADAALLHVEYLKGNFFHVIHADGVFGGVTPHAKLQIDFWSERHPIPQSAEFRLLPDGRLGPEIEGSRTGKVGVVREVGVEVLMDLNTVVAFHNWLGAKITEFRALEARRESVRQKLQKEAGSEGVEEDPQ